MKFTIFSFALCLCFLSFTDKNTYSKRHKFPPGVVKLTDDLCIDKAEVANVHWREYLYWLQSISKDTLGVLENYPDTLVWDNEPFKRRSAFSMYYHNHPMYNYSPVVGITYEQANAYCKWRSAMVNELYRKMPKLNPFPGKTYSYRLPTEKEWELAAMNKVAIDKFPYGSEPIIGKYYSFNCIYKGSDTIGKNLEEKIRNVDLPPSNNYKIHNLIGNVSEMISEKGIAKGGNFLLPLEDCKIIKQQHYNKPEAWLGFRCVCEIVDSALIKAQ